MNSTAESNLLPTRTNAEADQGARTLKSCHSRSERTRHKQSNHEGVSGVVHLAERSERLALVKVIVMNVINRHLSDHMQQQSDHLNDPHAAPGSEYRSSQ